MNEDPVITLWGWKKEDEKLPPPHITLNRTRQIYKNVSIIGPDHPGLETWLSDAEFPDLKFTFDQVRKQYHWVVATDLVRLVALYNLGGLYLDLDCFIDPDLPDHLDCDTCVFRECVLPDVRRLGRRECKHPCRRVRVANFAIYSRRKKSEFLRACIILALQRLNHLLFSDKLSKLSREDILWACGPDLVTSVYHERTSQLGQVCLLPAQLVGHVSAQSWATGELSCKNRGSRLRSRPR